MGKTAWKLRAVIVVLLQIPDFGSDLQGYIFKHIATPFMYVIERYVSRNRAVVDRAIRSPVIRLTNWVQKQLVEGCPISESDSLFEHLEEMRKCLEREKRKRRTLELRRPIENCALEIKKSNVLARMNRKKKETFVDDENESVLDNQDWSGFIGRHSVAVFRKAKGAFR